MLSKASIKGHPIHPMLIGFPVAFFSGTLLFDVLYQLNRDATFWNTAGHLGIAGVITALLAAVPGIIDYLSTVPPKSSARKRAAQHGLLNITHVALFAIAWWLRNDEHESQGIIIALESIGFILLSVAGWMGGTLVYRNQIGVDPRYAHAGKWKELHLDGNAPYEVATIGELKTDQMKLLHVKGKRVVLGRTETGYVAFDDHCTHKGGSLAGGSMICGTVQCPWHGTQFDVHTGMVKAGPAQKGINVYEVTEKDGKIYLKL